MRTDKRVAFKLRKSGKSYQQIMRELRVPKATLSGWFSGIDWSKRLRKELTKKNYIESTKRMVALDAIRGKRLARAYAEARKEARSELKALKYNPVFIAGLMLYWGEGDKRTNSQVRLTNTDPEMMRLFVFFLRNICRVPDEKMRGNVIIYPDLDATACVEYWSKRIRVNEKSFTKCAVISGRHPSRKISNGICIVIVSSTYLKVKVLEWMRLLPSELMSKRYYESIATNAGIV